MRFIKAGLVAVAIVLAIAPTPDWLVERWFSRAWYAAVQPVMTAASNRIPFTLFDPFCAALLLALTAWWSRALRSAPRGTRRRALVRLAGNTAAVVAVLYLWFLVAWGFNYRREKITARLDYDEQRITREALMAFASSAARSATTTRDRQGVTSVDLVAELSPAFAATLSTLRAEQARPSVPKWSVLTLVWRRVGVDGMTDPFFLESLVRTDLLPFERPFVVAHEWGHLAGYADESEASFIGYLTCLRGPVFAQYSAWLLMYAQVASELADADRRAVQRLLGPGPLADLRALAEKTRREVMPGARRVNTAVYDSFLKANRLERGVASYDEVTRLLVGTRMLDASTPAVK